MSDTIDLLAIGAHPDDVELTCGGTLARAAEQGHRTGVVDLTRGEMGTRGSPGTRAEEAAHAAEALGVAVRLNADLPDARLVNDDASRSTLVTLIRRLRPRAVILPFFHGRHPDHRVASELGRDACFLAGLSKYEAEGEAEPHRPHKILYALSYREDAVKPTFVVHLEGSHFKRKMEAIRCYASQFDDVVAAGELFPTGQALYDLVETHARRYGSLIRSPYGEPFYTEETMRVDDVLELEGSSL